MKKWFLSCAAFAFILLVSACSNETNADGAAKPQSIKLDYAYYSPSSLVLKKFGWLEEDLKEDGVKVEYVLSQGSNKALEFLNSSSIDFGSTAGAAAYLAKSKGAPVQSIYVYSKPEWTALVTTKGSGISSVEDLKGKKIAATVGTDPYIFLLRALDEAGLSQGDVEIVNLQHSDGASALTTGQVDAWAGLDPHMARVELEADTELFYRNPDFNTYGVLNVRSEFAEKYPAYAEKVIAAYEKAREWILDNPEEAAKILSEEAQISLEVAQKQLERNDFSSPVPGDVQVKALQSAGSVLKEDGIINKETDTDQLAEDLIFPDFAEKVINK
ncbi:aliphatic sulfonate ABC transporter substrate-binding protein [Bacillus lacus]|uniref:Putative aliphatic sulfonates-binding protein n=1 Tax=Metabacillus lacus TaxID=1983721 RepID=A0A7X2J0I5_9BACI|nr:aliphatic sulfonate ABC transporter substrate-binding protein [Metabacillus lacus]MRX73091.1 aliphatic sulfonate ABC transporter substrate-binding protein [Metabacillus lacus]